MTASRLTRAVAFAAALAVAACATPPEEPEARAEFEEINDPLEPMNRAVFAFNDGLDQAVIKPVAEGYREVVPRFGRDRVRDFLGFLEAPIVFANDLLQGSPDRAGVTLGRFVLNGTFGVLGIMDVASALGLPEHEEDFGQTLAVWGIGEGPYLVLPVLGPSNPRDALGRVVDGVASPVNQLAAANDATWITSTRTAVDGIDFRSRNIEELEDIRTTSIDYYAAIRSMWRQDRAQEIENRDPDD